MLRSRGLEFAHAPHPLSTQKPVEIGLRADAVLLSCRDEATGEELENVEGLMTDQGLYIYKTYTNGHALETHWHYVYE